MAKAAGQIITDILRTVRDPSGTAHTRDFVRTLVSDVQRLVNIGRRLVLTTTSFTAQPLQQIYTELSLVDISDLGRIEAVLDGSEDLVREQWGSLAAHTPQWFRKNAQAPELWASIGRDGLLVHPAPMAAKSLTVRYAKLTTALENDSDETEIPDERLPIVEALVARMLLVRQRLFESAKGETEDAEIEMKLA